MSPSMDAGSEKRDRTKERRESDTGDDDDEELYYDNSDYASPEPRDLNEDGDVIERIRSRASISSDFNQLKQLRETYPEGRFRLNPDDPRKPQNWSLRKRLGHTLAYGLTTLSTQIGSSAFAPAAWQLAREMRTTGVEVGVLAFSVFSIGNMLGTLLFSPVSEMFGRKVGIFVPLFVTGIFHCVCANAESMAAVVVYRFFAGVFAGAPMSISGAAMSDMWRYKSRAGAMALYGLTVLTGTAVAPIFGALLIDTGSYGWRWIEWLGGLLAMAVAFVMALLLSESYLPILENQLARTLRLDSGFWGLHSDHDAYRLDFSEILKVHLARPILMLATPIITCLVVFSSFGFGLVFILITTVGEAYQRHHGFTRASSYCPMVSFVIGYAFGCGAHMLQSKRYARRQARMSQPPAPEERLIVMMLLGWLLPGGMFVYGWCMRSNIHWIVPTIGLGMVGAGLATVFQGTIVYLTDVYQKYSASVVGANTFVRSILTGVFPLFSRQMYRAMGPGWASSLLGFIGVAMLPLPWIFYAFGPNIRNHDPFRERLAL